MPTSARRNPMQSPLPWVCIGEEEQGSERNFRRTAEMEWCGLCDDDVGADAHIRPFPAAAVENYGRGNIGLGRTT